MEMGTVRTAVVLGNCRSGTSLIAGILSKMGIEMDDAHGRSDGLNPAGYFESLGAHQINTQLFRLAWGGSLPRNGDAHL